MSFSYNESQISASGTNYISMVRFQVDDTDSITHILSDELITALYNETPSTASQIFRNFATAIGAAEFIYRRYSKMPISWSSAGTSVNRSDRLTSLDALLARLRMLLFQTSGASPILYADRPTDFQRCR